MRWRTTRDKGVSGAWVKSAARRQSCLPAIPPGVCRPSPNVAPSNRCSRGFLDPADRREPQLYSGGMLSEPQLQYCDARPYAAIRTRMNRPAQVAALAPLIWAEVRSWLAFEGRLEAGPPFVRYHRVDSDGSVELEAGLTIFSPLHLATWSGSGRIATGVLPAGEYATLLHNGPYDELSSARDALGSWGREQGVLPAALTAVPAGELIEFYLRDQETEVAFHVPETVEA
ncbi:MAG: GyrI-like domain-containing protein [Steroidobacteraceae bacterium]